MPIVNRLEAPDSEAELREAWQPGRTRDRQYKERANKMSAAFEISGKNFWKAHFGPHNYELKAWLGGLVLGGTRSWWTEPWSGVDKLYPEPGELRTKLRALEIDSSPLERTGDVQEGLVMLRDFVESYEAAFQDKTEWELVYLWKRDENQQIVRDGKGVPVLAQEAPIARHRLPVIMYY